MIFGLVIICTMSGQPCAVSEVRGSPFADRDTCREVHAARRAEVQGIIAPSLARAWRQRVQVWEVCDTLARIRRVVPDAFPGVEPEDEA